MGKRYLARLTANAFVGDNNAQLVAGDPLPGQSRHGPVQHSEERVGEESECDQVGVNQTDAARREYRNPR